MIRFIPAYDLEGAIQKPQTEHRLMLQWWTDFLNTNRKGMVRPFEFAQKG